MKQTMQLATLLLLSCIVQFSKGADLAIQIPGDLSKQDGFYRLDYSPPVGFPAANTTFRPQARSIKREILNRQPLLRKPKQVALKKPILTQKSTL